MRFKTGLSILLSLLLSWLCCSPAWSRPVLQTTVNAVLGDRSYTERFGTLPSAQTNEKLRIQTHLSYVEKLLKSHTPDSIPQQLYPRRQHMISLLSQYIQQGIFPRQQAYRGRRPHFIDEQGRLCAVGYLVAKTAGLPLVQKINQQYAYSYLPDMQMPELNSWVKGSGLTVQELAMIQPTYDYARQDERFFFGMSFFVLGLLQYALLAAHTGLLVWAHDDEAKTFPTFYSDIQIADVIVTTASIGLLVVMSVLMPFMAPPDSVVGFYILLLGGTLLIPPAIINGAALYHLDALKQAQNKLSLGFFETPDQKTSWGLHASLSF